MRLIATGLEPEPRAKTGYNKTPRELGFFEPPNPEYNLSDQFLQAEYESLKSKQRAFQRGYLCVAE